jgi:DNA-binding transcriptional MerR regulator
MNKSEYTIQDLYELTRIPRRTIHFYTQQGILPPPSGAGLGARYDDIHLMRLRLIPFFRRQGLRLDDIRKKFNELSIDKLKAYLAQSKISEPQLQQQKGQSYTHYSLPAGMILVVPTTLSQTNREKLSQFLNELQNIFHDSEKFKEQ